MNWFQVGFSNSHVKVVFGSAIFYIFYVNRWVNLVGGIRVISYFHVFMSPTTFLLPHVAAVLQCSREDEGGEGGRYPGCTRERPTTTDQAPTHNTVNPAKPSQTQSSLV